MPKKTTTENRAQSTRMAMEDVDRIFHEKARLGILTSIVGVPEGLNFNDLKQLCGLTDGNLNRHLKVLLDANILNVKKTGRGRNTNSIYRLTKKGNDGFRMYLSALETILKNAHGISPDSRSKKFKRSLCNTEQTLKGNDGKHYFTAVLIPRKLVPVGQNSARRRHAPRTSKTGRD